MARSRQITTPSGAGVLLLLVWSSHGRFLPYFRLRFSRVMEGQDVFLVGNRFSN